MPTETTINSTSRTLRLAIVVELVFLAAAALLLFTEHRAHYLAALPYAIAIAAATACLWLQVEVRKHLRGLNQPGSRRDSPEKGGQSHES
jgi:hypothetical protein